MRKISTYVKFNVLMMVMLFGILTINNNVQAKPDVLNGFVDISSFYNDGPVPQYYFIDVINPTKKTSVKKLKSSNRKIVKTKWDKNLNQIRFDVYRPGKATVTGVLYDGKNKIKNFKIKVSINKYECPLKTFKVGNKDYASEYNKTNSYGKTFEKGKKLKVYVEAKKGWKLERISYGSGKKLKKVSNNSVITFNKENSYIMVEFFNKKKKNRITLTYNLWM